MVTGRAGSALTAEIGIMRITEQIDALTVMALNPMRYLVVPSIVAGVITFPLMTALFDVVGIFGGYLVGVELLGLSPGTYFGEMQTFVDMGDVMTGFWKSISFGIIVTWVCTYKGFHVRARRRGRGARHHPGRGAVLGAHPGVGLLPGLGAAVIRVIKVSLHQRPSAASRVLRGVDLESRRPATIMVDHRPERRRQVGASSST